jgi:hypothetical protein
MKEEKNNDSGKLLVAEGSRKDSPIKGRVISEGELQGVVVYFSQYGYDTVEGYAIVPKELIICKVDYKEE